MSDCKFAYLAEQAKRMVRRANLKGSAIPGYLVLIPEPLRCLEPRESETQRMHALKQDLGKRGPL